MNIGQVEKAFSDAVTATAPTTPFTPNAPNGSWRGRFCLISDVVIHIRRGADADVANGIRIPANTLVQIELENGDTLSYVKGTGAADGTIWIAKG